MYRLSPLLLGLVLALAACDTAEDGDALETVALQFAGLEPLEDGYHYEGWALIGGTPVSTGRFNVDAQGRLVDLDGDVVTGGRFATGRDLGAATAIVVTIEPPNDADPAPAATHVLAGSLSGGTASLTVGHADALGTDFAGATGGYILATPTTAAMDDERSGVWFIDNTDGTMMPGLSLPALPDGWTYEGWAVIDGQPVTTGTFDAVDAADDAAPFSGPGAGPPFPGEDFVQNAPAGLSFPTDLRGGMVVVSVEPVPDPSPAPFTLKPLAGPVPADAEAGTFMTLNNDATSFPTGTARLQD